MTRLTPAPKLIELALPPLVKAADVWSDADATHPMTPARRGRVVGMQRHDYERGRRCARAALADLGARSFEVGRGANREPIWPSGVIGSITHTRRYCAAAVTWSVDFCAVGIDAEPNEPLPAEVVDYVLTPTERAWLRSRSALSVAWDRLVFSAKEAVYKTWFPLTGECLDFSDVVITCDSFGSGFRARIRRTAAAELAPASLCGRFAIRSDVLVTAIALPRVQTGQTRRRTARL